MIDREKLDVAFDLTKKAYESLGVIRTTERFVERQTLEQREAISTAFMGVSDMLRAAANTLDHAIGRTPLPDTSPHHDKPEPNEDLRVFRAAFERARGTTCPLFEPETDFERPVSLRTSMQYTIWFFGQVVENLENGEP